MHPFRILWVLLFIWCGAEAAPSTALLTGPEEVSFSGPTYPLGRMPFELEIQWEEEIPLELDLYLIDGRPKAGGHFATFSFKDSSGKAAEIWDIVGSYLPAQGKMRIGKGQTIKIGITGHGWASVVSGEKYTLSVFLYGRVKDQIVTIEGRKEVIFTRTSPPAGKNPIPLPEPTSG